MSTRNKLEALVHSTRANPVLFSLVDWIAKENPTNIKMFKGAMVLPGVSVDPDGLGLFASEPIEREQEIMHINTTKSFTSIEIVFFQVNQPNPFPFEALDRS